jgi:hypothetical protein
MTFAFPLYFGANPCRSRLAARCGGHLHSETAKTAQFAKGCRTPAADGRGHRHGRQNPQGRKPRAAKRPLGRTDSMRSSTTATACTPDWPAGAVDRMLVRLSVLRVRIRWIIRESLSQLRES